MVPLAPALHVRGSSLPLHSLELRLDATPLQPPRLVQISTFVRVCAVDFPIPIAHRNSQSPQMQLKSD
jgi:hypothetical protein